MSRLSDDSLSPSVDLEDPTISIHGGGSAELWDRILSQEGEEVDGADGYGFPPDGGNAGRSPPSTFTTTKQKEESSSKSFGTYRTSPTCVDLDGDTENENATLYPPLPSETCDEHEDLLPSAFLADNDDADALQDAMKALMRERQEGKQDTKSEDGIMESLDVVMDRRMNHKRDEAGSSTDAQSETLSNTFSCES